VERGPAAERPVGLRIDETVALGDELPPVDPLDEPAPGGEKKVAPR
jgi:hypothetical protein